MKRNKKLNLTLITTILFVILFYNQYIGINFGIIAIVTWLLFHLNTDKKRKTKNYWLLSGMVFIGFISQIYYADTYSFFALFIALSAYGVNGKYENLNIILYPFLRFYNSITFIFRLLHGKWMPSKKANNKVFTKIIALVIIPLIFSIIFLLVYATGSSTISDFFKNLSFSFDPSKVILLTLLGGFFFFNFWFTHLPRLFATYNQKMTNDFEPHQQKERKQTVAFLPLDLERKSGEISLIMLNIFLLIFIITFNYEQFYQTATDTTLSDATHERVQTIIFSIVLAIAVILFYFKSTFNFDHEATLLKKLTYFWIALNGVLVLSAITKNTEYIYEFGLTHKRIGVYIFLILCIIGLFFSYLKIKNKKTNIYLINRMTWTFLIAFNICSVINFSWIITKHNLTVNKGVEIHYLRSLHYNDQLLYNHFKEDLK
ncbi:DUF4153 domain-containing protein [Brumimicrobium aurantiacum]|uniref:DUF4173 domain-containing protein n=1 Tax=Brumimicrobium aurantiacum TaxID=1737063 RepID=A0A3E1EXD1_9FLAO|nr:DUF4173 domain-containing protein [Brumimicrobium aurantiacum]RFC54209.1 DUF4173 domain-containing protein [Brumimicrobium aurantiacum]